MQPKRSTSDNSKTASRDPAAVRAPHPDIWRLWAPLAFRRLASLRRSLMEPRLRTSRSPASPRPCPIPGVSRSGASDCDVSPSTHARRHRSRRRNRLKQTPNQRPPSRSRNASYVGQKVYRSRAGVRLTLQGSPANRSLSAIEPVSAPPKWKLKNGDQRLAPKTRPAVKGLWLLCVCGLSLRAPR